MSHLRSKIVGRPSWPPLKQRPPQIFIGPFGAFLASVFYLFIGAASYFLAAVLFGSGAAKLFPAATIAALQFSVID